MSSSGPFSRRGLVALVAVLSVSFLAVLIWGVFGGEIRPTSSAQADSFSRSALGHSAFVALLRELGIDTIVSRNNSGAKAGRRAALVVAEPHVNDNGLRAGMLRRMLERAENHLLVLPKWKGVEDPEHDGWVKGAKTMWRVRVEKVLSAIGGEVDVVRVDADVAVGWRTTGLVAKPRLGQPQLIRGSGIEPLIACDKGVLLGRVPTRIGPVLVLADPDLMSNHGLARPGNAVVMMRVLELLRADADTPVVLDETLHGFGREPSVFRALFDFPLLLATLQALAIVALLLWAAMGRFGPPQPVDPPLGAGKETLIRNTAALFARGGHAGHAVARYLAQVTQETHRQLHAPARFSPEQAEAWLDKVAATRGIKPPLSSLRERVEALGAAGGDHSRRALVAARHIHRWKEEMFRGRSHHS
ncbi:MAG: DUF4350 domain-containing protein [Planctomycetota bacterium]